MILCAGIVLWDFMCKNCIMWFYLRELYYVILYAGIVLCDSMCKNCIMWFYVRELYYVILCAGNCIMWFYVRESIKLCMRINVHIEHVTKKSKCQQRDPPSCT